VKPNASFGMDTIFDLISINKSVEYFLITDCPSFKLNLKNINSLRFIEKNSTLKTLNLSNIYFSNIEMKVLNESLLMNQTLTELDFSHSNFNGPFEFLNQPNLKKFKYIGIWYHDESEDLKEFFQNLKSSKLNYLDLSVDYGIEFEITDIGDLINVLENHETIEILVMNCISNLKDSINFKQLLRNQKLKELHLIYGIDSSDSLRDLFIALNENDNLTHLDVSFNDHIHYQSTTKWDDIKITNKTLQTLQMTSNIKFIFIQR
jgi:hypothetical protein